MSRTQNPLVKWQGPSTAPCMRTALWTIFHITCLLPWLWYTSPRSPEALHILLQWASGCLIRSAGHDWTLGLPGESPCFLLRSLLFLKAYTVSTLLLSSIQPFRGRFHSRYSGTLVLLLYHWLLLLRIRTHRWVELRSTVNDCGKETVESEESCTALLCTLNHHSTIKPFRLILGVSCHVF